MQKAISIYGTNITELNELLRDNWIVINQLALSSNNSNGLSSIYILEKNNNLLLTSDELKLIETVKDKNYVFMEEWRKLILKLYNYTQS